MKVIVNADDFGSAIEVNKAILKSFRMGIISSSTILANGQAFEDAIQIVHKYHLIDNIGIHINLNTDFPITENIKKFKKFCHRDGSFINKRYTSLKIFYPLSSNELEVLKKEIEAQIHKCKSYGLILTHADSHYHKHTEWNISRVIAKVLFDEHIKSIRLARNCGVGINFPKRLYKIFFNYTLNLKGFNTVNCFGSFEDFLYYFSKKNNISCSAIEVMCHPKLVNNVVVDSNVPLKLKVLKLKKMIRSLKLISYKEL